MKVTFSKGYMCCGCNRRYSGRNVVYSYKETCICKNCYQKFKRYSDEAYFDVSDEVEFLVSAFHYKSAYRQMFLDFKFNGQLANGHVLGMAIADILKNRDSFADYDYIVPVPISNERFAERGYNQSEIIAEYISEALGIPMLNALKRTRHSNPQSTVETSKRAENVKGAYEITDDFKPANLILFDDICTTGSTVSECSRTLKKAGAKKVCAVSGAYNIGRWIDRTIHRFI